MCFTRLSPQVKYRIEQLRKILIHSTINHMKNIENHKLGIKRTLGIIAAILVILAIAFLLVIYDITYHSQVNSEDYMQIHKRVELKYVGRDMYFDGPGEDTLFVFYQENLVETESYTPLLAGLAESGIDCVAVHAPLNIAVFSNYDMASVVSDEKISSYKHYYVGGHSLGGFYLTDYAFNNVDKVDGLIYLASYGYKDYKASKLPVLSIYGSRDKILDIDALAISEFFMPKDYTSVCIDGANHAQFGCYGTQKNDGEATISERDQWIQTINLINSFINSNNKK